MRYEDVEGMKDKTVGDLIDEIAHIEGELERYGKVHLFLYRAIIEEMDEIGATVARSETHVAKLTPKVTYDQSVLAKLREITAPEDLEGIYTPEREVVKVEAERWNMVRGKKLLRLGNEHQSIIADAKIYRNPTLKVSEKGDDNG